LEPFARPLSGLAKPPRERGDELARALEHTSRGIRDPVAKLRYIRGSLDRYRRLDRLVRVLPLKSLRRQVYRWLSLESLGPLLRADPFGAAPPVDRSTRALRMVTRLGLAAAMVVLVAGVALATWSLPRPAPAVVKAATPARALTPAAETPVTLPAGITPSAVWLVEKGEGWEQYSNGLRIDTSHALAGEPRRYHVFDENGALLPEVHDQPVGIVFHTSESDIWPLEASFNESLRDSSQRLLRYLQKNRTYHYLVDRFGRVFRVVNEDSKANHAGYAVWSAPGAVYLSLNNAFLGVSFESRWEGGRAMPITQAQLAAGRNLTEYLRQRYDISADMCVAHGLASVNPKKHLIGHHMDWSRGFPWEAFGLPDQYQREAPSVGIFGFGYDDDFLKVLGEPWQGVRDGESRLAREARSRGVEVKEVRRERQGLYDRAIAAQAAAERSAVASLPDQRPVNRPRTSASGG
jgi:N-acetylmuramoyl-L-alanine amidase